VATPKRLLAMSPTKGKRARFDLPLNHVYEIPMHLYLDLDQKPMNECSTKFDDCIAYKQVLIQINHIRSYMTIGNAFICLGQKRGKVSTVLI
jgi:hypothetical protein